jgi:hypothetical protein
MTASNNTMHNTKYSRSPDKVENYQVVSEMAKK